MVSNQDSVERYQHKSFHELLLELRNVGLKARDLIEEAIKQGQNEGITNDEIRRQILEIGIPYRTMLEYIPEELKQKQTHAKSRQKVASLQPTYKRDQSRLIIEGEIPRLPPREEQMIEPQRGSEEEPTPQELADVAAFNQAGQESVPKEFTLSMKIIESHSWAKAVGWARSNGEDIILLPNKHGQLNLKV